MGADPMISIGDEAAVLDEHGKEVTRGMVTDVGELVHVRGDDGKRYRVTRERARFISRGWRYDQARRGKRAAAPLLDEPKQGELFG